MDWSRTSLNSIIKPGSVESVNAQNMTVPQQYRKPNRVMSAHVYGDEFGTPHAIFNCLLCDRPTMNCDEHS